MLATLLCCLCHCPPPPIHPLHRLCPNEVHVEPCLHRPAWRWWDCADRARWP